MSFDEEEEEKKPSSYHIFVDNVDGYVGSAVSNYLIKQGYSVTGYGNSTNPNIQKVSSRQEGIFNAEMSVFDMTEDPSSVNEALQIVNSHPLHHKVHLVLFSSLLTWGGRPLKHPEEEETKNEDPQDEPEADPESKEGKEEEEENLDEPEPFDPINEDDFLSRIPHPIAKAIYETESRALQLADENERLRITIFGVGLLYGNGEHILYPFFRALWEGKVDSFPGSKAHICCLHVSNLGIAVKQLLLQSASQEAEESEEPPKQYEILCEPTCHTFNAISNQITKFLAKNKKPIDINTFPQGLSQIPALSPIQNALLTTELAAESTQALEEFTPEPEDIIGAAAKIVDEFRRKCSIEPQKILVVGPPGSGFLKIATQISNSLKIPLVDPATLCIEAQKDNTQWGQDITQEIQDSLEDSEENNDGNQSDEPVKKIIPMEKISAEIVSKIVHHRMDAPDCHNRGWVIAGFADNYTRASTLFDEGEEEQASPYFEHIPTKVVVLDADDGELRKRAAELGGGTKEKEAFEKLLRAYRTQGEPKEGDEAGDEDEGKDFLSFFDDRSISSLVVDAFATPASMKDILNQFLGGKRDFGRPPEEIAAEEAAKREAEIEKAEKEKKIKDERLAEQKTLWAEGDGIHDAAVKRLDSADEGFLAEKAKDLEEYLGQEVMDHIIEGLCTIGKEMPEDPVDALAAFFFAQNRKMKAKQ